jgi:hypothetical protein
MTDNAPTIEGLQEQLADLEARIERLENRDASAPPFVTAGLALEPVLARARRQLGRVRQGAQRGGRDDE